MPAVKKAINNFKCSPASGSGWEAVKSYVLVTGQLFSSLDAAHWLFHCGIEGMAKNAFEKHGEV